MAARGGGGGERRTRPNVLVTGTPGTGKTTTCSLLADAVGLRHINIGDLVREKSLHDGWDEELECHIINEDLYRSIFVTFLGCDQASINVRVVSANNAILSEFPTDGTN